MPSKTGAGIALETFTSNNKDSQRVSSTYYIPGVLLCYLHIISLNFYHNPVKYILFVTFFFFKMMRKLVSREFSNLSRAHNQFVAEI